MSRCRDRFVRIVTVSDDDEEEDGPPLGDSGQVRKQQEVTLGVAFSLNPAAAETSSGEDTEEGLRSWRQRGMDEAVAAAVAAAATARTRKKAKRPQKRFVVQFSSRCQAFWHQSPLLLLLSL